MGLEIAATRKKCNICKQNRAQRYCLRYGKDICWVCCNSKRIDKKCPNECSYIIDKTEEDVTNGLKTKVDSYQEYLKLLALNIDIWAELPEKLFNNKIPSEMAQTKEGKQELEVYLDNLDKIPPQTTAYLRYKLHLPAKKKKTSHFEDNAMRYLDKIIEQEWEDTIGLTADNSRFDNELYRNNHLFRRKENNLLKKMQSYHLILSLVSEKLDESLVYFEINGKYDLTMNLIVENNEWKVKALILGSPRLFYGVGEIEEQIISSISLNYLNQAEDKLKKFAGILIDSPEIFYLFGILFAIREDYDKANKMFLNCLEIKPLNFDYKYNYAFTLQAQDKQLDTVENLYRELIKQKPDDLKTLNNLAVIQLNKGQLAEAKEIWQQCLKYDSTFEPALKNLERFEENS